MNSVNRKWLDKPWKTPKASSKKVVEKYVRKHVFIDKKTQLCLNITSRKKWKNQKGNFIHSASVESSVSTDEYR